MRLHHGDDRTTIWHGDALEVLRGLPDASVDAIVTDPPAGISFMGKEWDGAKGGREQWSAWLAEVMREAYRVTKPGGHALVWALPRTSHWTACGLEDAGWEIRDKIVHLFGSGFPKSLDVSKAIDKAAGAEREVVGRYQPPNGKAWNLERDESVPGNHGQTMGEFARRSESMNLTAPATPDAERWQGWGTALKPAAEDWWLARKPLTGTVAANVLQHGTGALNIDACRVETTDDLNGGAYSGEKRRRDEYTSTDTAEGAVPMSRLNRGIGQYTAPAGRWPTNVVLDDSQAAELDEQSGVSRDGVAVKRNGVTSNGVTGWGTAEPGTPDAGGYGGEGGASRFFPTFRYEAKAPTSERPRVNGTAHPTVKPLDLMRWLVRLVTPPGGTVLEPFAGSGTTVEACIVEGFHCIAIEREADYLPLIMQRINRRRDPVAYIKAAGDELGLFDLEGLA